jgi:hypothetical protein
MMVQGHQAERRKRSARRSQQGGTKDNTFWKTQYRNAGATRCPILRANLVQFIRYGAFSCEMKKLIF